MSDEIKKKIDSAIARVQRAREKFKPGPPEWFKQKQQGQTFMFDYDKAIQEQPLCRKCNLKFAAK